MALRASIIVPTYRRPQLLNRCLAALVAQDFDPAAYEIIVADNAGSPETESLVAKWSANAGAPLRYVPADRSPGPAAARNVGWRAAEGEVIAFTDDDCIPEPGWLRAGIAALENGIAAAGGRIRVPLSQPPTDYERNEAGLEGVEFATANCFCRREVLAAIGGFDERFTMAWREDSDLQFKLLENSLKVVSAPTAVVAHPVRPGRWAISLSQQRKSMFNALLYKNHPALYRRQIEPTRPWHYYGNCVAWLAALGSAWLGQSALALTAAGVWLLLTGRFCVRRLRRTSHAPYHVAEMVLTSALIPSLSLFWRIRGAFKFRVLFW
jgi:glycosyltransferase involved in cell wall biosynthesis